MASFSLHRRLISFFKSRVLSTGSSTYPFFSHSCLFTSLLFLKVYKLTSRQVLQVFAYASGKAEHTRDELPTLAYYSLSLFLSIFFLIIFASSLSLSQKEYSLLLSPLLQYLPPSFASSPLSTHHYNIIIYSLFKEIKYDYDDVLWTG